MKTSLMTSERAGQGFSDENGQIRALVETCLNTNDLAPLVSHLIDIDKVIICKLSANMGSLLGSFHMIPFMGATMHRKECMTQALSHVR